jgi:hypothetical protein
MEVSGCLYVPAALLLEKKNAWYPLNRRLDGPQCQFGCFGEEINLSSSPESNIIATVNLKNEYIFSFIQCEVLK